MMRVAVLVAGALAWAAPLVLGIGFALVIGSSPDDWRAFFAHPQIPLGLLLSLWTGSAGLALALAAAIAMVMALHGSRAWRHMPMLCGAGLALPHLAFAIGLGFLIMPGGVVARVLVGGEAPPQWVTIQDPWGLSLIAALALKETPFIVLVLWSAMTQDEGARLLQDQMRSARALGHGPRSAWLRVLLPQLLRRIAGPLIVVWVYGVTVVDLALVMGPTQPPAAGVAIWADLNDVARDINRRGVAGTVAMTAMLAVLGAAAWLALRLARPLIRDFLTRGPGAAPLRRWPGLSLGWLIAGSYAAVLLVLALISISPRWPYPQLVPEAFSLASWRRLAVPPLIESLALATLTALSSLALIVMWFETRAARRDRAVEALALAALALPALAIAAGQYRLFLFFGLTGTQAGLFLAHLTPVLAYSFILLRGPYRGFDPRYATAGRSLGVRAWRCWARIKLPLLRAPLAAALAVGFSVSLVQFVPAQLIAAGRYSTLPMEAVTLASGGNRSLTAASALVLALPALLAFALAGIAGRPRWR